MPNQYTRKEFIERKNERTKIYGIIIAFVDSSDDYWISFKKLRKVLRCVDDVRVFFAPYVTKDGKFNPDKLEEFTKLVDEKYAIYAEQQRIINEQTAIAHAERKKAKAQAAKQTKVAAVKVSRPAIRKPISAPLPDEPKQAETPTEGGGRKRIRRVRLSEAQIKELEKLRKEKSNK
ncbi:MAG: hypothetical protein LBL74_02915 [Bacteroidales bacterium]|jgi:hypothetical protein|nr:hypothetical protein [Bacteroidales bacterium]